MKEVQTWHKNHVHWDLSQSNDRILLFWVLLPTVETENSLCTRILFWEITWCLFFFPLSSFSWLFTSHALSEWHKPADLRSKAPQLYEASSQSRGRVRRVEVQAKTLGEGCWWCMCVPAPTEYIHAFWCVCLCLFLGAEIQTKSSSQATENTAAAHHSGPDWLAGTWAIRSGPF